MPKPKEKPFEAYKGDAPFVFVSYAHDDAEAVYADLLHLHQKGCRIWYDEGIAWGQSFHAEIERAIKKSLYFLVFISPRSVQSTHVRKEIFLADAKKKQLLPIFLEETELAEGLEFVFTTIERIDRHNKKRDDYLDELVKKLPKAVREPSKAEPPTRDMEFAQLIGMRIKEQHGYDEALEADLLATAELMGLSADSAQATLTGTLGKLGIDGDYAERVKRFQQLIVKFLSFGPIEPLRRQILENRAKDLGVAPDQAEALIQKEAVAKARTLADQGDISLAVQILMTAVGNLLPQSPEMAALLEELDANLRRTAAVAASFKAPTLAETAKKSEGSPALPVLLSAGLDQSPEAALVVAPVRRPASADRAVTYLVDGVSIAWVRIPAGLFVRGCPREFIRHIESRFAVANVAEAYQPYSLRKETLEEFWIALTSITNEQFYAFVKATGHRYPAGWRGTTPPYPRGDADKPVTGVTWQDSVDFADWLGARLPSRAEMEKACRGEDGLLFPWGNEFDAAKCNTAEAELGHLMPSSAYPAGASPYGVLELVGNAWEWVEDDRSDLNRSNLKMTVGASFEFQGEIYGVGFFDMSRPLESSENDLGFRIACSDVRKLLLATEGVET